MRHADSKEQDTMVKYSETWKQILEEAIGQDFLRFSSPLCNFSEVNKNEDIYPMDILGAEEEEKKYSAYTLPGCSRIPDKIFFGDTYLVPTHHSGIGIRISETVPQEKHKCNCPIGQLMAEGCKCGGI